MNTMAYALLFYGQNLAVISKHSRVRGRAENSTE